jgi:gamma-glutamyltranspeptidase/glutathione hydrolase
MHLRLVRFARVAGLLVVFACGTAPPPDSNAPRATAAAATPIITAETFPVDFPLRRANVAESAHGMVVTDAPIGTQVGAAMLAAGGNAADAAVAISFALAVAFPTAGNVGGGGFALTRSANGEFNTLDFRETAPGSAKADMYGPNEGGMFAPSRFGHRSAGVPGSVAGMYALYQKYGSKKKSWPELLAPAIRLAEEGFPVDADFVRTVDQVKDRLKKFPASAALFVPDGAPLKLGSTFKNPDLAKVLHRIADAGPKGFYEGPTADAIVAEMKRGGADMSLDDLKKYEAKWRTPIEFTYRSHRIVSMPPPSSGGLTLAMMSAILEAYPLGQMPWRAPKEIHLMVESSRRAFAARNMRLGDPDFVKNPVEELMSKGWADAQRATIREDRATPSAELGITEKKSGGAGPHTTHFSIVDGQGNVVAMTTTLNWWYGSGVTVEGAGFLLNNEMDDFAVIPGTANTFGLVQGEQNSVAAGKRMLSSMAPTVVLGPDGKVKLVLGAAGGPTIISAVMQIMQSVVDHGLDLATAEAAPRFHHQALPDVITIEKNGLTKEQRTALEAMGHTLKEREHIADGPSIGWNGSAWVGAPEPRRKGTLALGPDQAPR